MSKVYAFRDIEEYLEDNGWYYTHNTYGWDNHYVSENDIPIDIVLDVSTGECDFYIINDGKRFTTLYKFIDSPTISDIKLLIRNFKITKLKERISNDT